MSQKAILAALAAAASFVVFAAQSPVLAQDTGGATQTAENGRSVEVVTVTAERRPENMEKVPIAVTPISGEQMREQGITTALDLQNNAPSLSITGELGQRDDNVFTIRGQSQPFGGADPGVQSYFAEVPFNASGVGNYYDMDNIQVLNGPQGTLFGRNTTGGAVLFQPKKPTDQFGGYLDAQAGNYSMYEFSGAVNIPVITDKFDLRVAGDVASRDGYTKNIIFDALGNPVGSQNTDNLNYESFRVSAVIRPFAGFENYTVFDYLRDHNHGTGASLTGVNVTTIDQLASEFLGFGYCASNPGDLTCQTLTGFEQEMLGVLAQQKALGIRTTTSSLPLFYNRDTWGVTDIATYEFNDHLRLRNIFGYREDKVADGFDYDGSLLPLLDIASPLAPQSHSYQITDEIQLQGESEHLKWILGYYHELDHPTGLSEIVRTTLGGAQPPNTPFADFGSTEIDDFTNGGSSDAVFGQATYDFSGNAQGLSITAGGRYTWDTKVAKSKLCIASANTLPVCPFPLPDIFMLPTQRASFQAPTWTLAAQYQFTPDTMLYATYRRGYKSGGFNSGAGALTDFSEFKPEYLTDFEIGTKNNWTIMGTPGRTNFDMYYGWYSNVQKNDLVVVQNTSFPPEPLALTFNAAKATIKGLEFESTFIPDDNFQVSIFYSYTDASYDHFVLPSVIFNGVPLGDIDHAGNPFAYTPRNKLGLTGRFHIPVAASYGIPTISATWYWQSQVWFTDLSDIESTCAAFIPPGNPQQPYTCLASAGQPPQQKSYGLVNLRADWNNVFGSPVDASFFVNNVTDQNYKVAANAALHLFGTTSSIYGPPRMWGFELRWRFGADAGEQ